MNPCPCGFYSHPGKQCTCSPSAVGRYQKRISGPLLDRVDVFVEVPPVEYDKLIDDRPGEDSSGPRERVRQARELQRERFEDIGFLCNSEMGPAEVWKFCQLGDGVRELLQTATQRLNPVGQSLPPGAEGIAHGCRPRRFQRNRGEPSGGGVTVPGPVGRGVEGEVRRPLNSSGQYLRKAGGT